MVELELELPGPKVASNNVTVLARYPELRRLYIRHLARYGNIQAACAYIKTSVEAFDKFRRDYPWFNKEIEAALGAHKHLIEKTIHKRAIDGWLEPKFGKFGVNGYVRKYSDTLLIAYARRHVPEYRQGEDSTQTIKGTVEHVHSVRPAELTPEQREALRLLLGDPQGEEVKPAEVKQITSTNGHAPGTNGTSKNGKH